MIDTHAHLDALDDPDAAVSRAAQAGVASILTVGTTVEGCRTALELADAHGGVFAILGIHPHEAASEGGRLDELEPLRVPAQPLLRRELRRIPLLDEARIGPAGGTHENASHDR